MQREISLRQRIESFKASITADLQSVHDFIDMEKVNFSIQQHTDALKALDNFDNENSIPTFTHLS